MNALCIRCLLNDMHGNFCPQCGSASTVPTHVPTVAELEALEAEVTALLPRLRQMRVLLNQSRSKAIQRRHFAAVQLVEKRQMFLLCIEQRLRKHLRFAQRELAERKRTLSRPSRA